MRYDWMKVVWSVGASIFLCDAALGEVVYPGRQAELAQEQTAFESCLEDSMTPNEAATCTHWLALSTCAMTTDDRLESVQKLVSPQALQAYRIAAGEALPAYCSPMAAVNLDLAILDADESFDAEFRMARWRKIFSAAPKLVAEQHFRIGREAAQSPELSALIHDKKTRSFLTQILDEITSTEPDISNDIVIFLREMEQMAPQLMNDTVRVYLMRDALTNRQYETARALFERIDFDHVSATQKLLVTPQIYASAVALFGRHRLDEAPCFEDFALPPLDHARLSRLALLDHPTMESSLTVLRYEASQQFPRCQFASVVHKFGKIWQTQYPLADVTVFGDELISLLERLPNDELLDAWIHEMDVRLQGKARFAFAQRYGARLSAMMVHRANGSSEKTALLAMIQRLSSALSLFSEVHPHDLLMAMGTVQWRLGFGERARQYWMQIIEDASAPGRLRAQAFYLSIRVLRQTGETKQAAALESRFRETLPSSPLHDMLNTAP